MAPITEVIMEAESNAAAEKFVREYVVDAYDRLPEIEGCEGFKYLYQRNLEEPDERRYVLLKIYGDGETIIEQERARWDSYVDKGMLIEWERGETMADGEMAEEFGEEIADLAERLNMLETRFAILALKEFDDLPAPVDAFPEKDTPPLGWWGVPHTVMYLLNYDLEDELNVYTYGIEHTLRNFAEFDSPERAEAELDALIDHLEDQREVVTEGRLDR